MDTLFKILIGIVGVWVGYRLAMRSRMKKVDYIKNQTENKNENKEKLLDIIKNHKDQITNDDVERILGVSDSTAERYLSELVEDGAIERVGDTGRGVYYKKK